MSRRSLTRLLAEYAAARVRLAYLRTQNRHTHDWIDDTDYASGPNRVYVCTTCPATKEEPRP